MTNINELTPAFATSPGEILKDELKARKMSKKSLAKKMGSDETFVKLVLNDHQFITAPVALKLEKALGIDALVWIAFQVNYLIDLAKIKGKQEVELLTKLRNKKTKTNGKDKSDNYQSTGENDH
jgi:addiction module HigA family antidote